MTWLTKHWFREKWHRFVLCPAAIEARTKPRGCRVTIGPGVYFLFCGDRIAYIGMSVCIARRMNEHVVPWDRIAWLHAPKEWMQAVETYYISLYDPPLNNEPGREPLMWNWANANG